MKKMDINGIKEKMKGRTPGVLGDRKEFAVLIPLLEREDGLHLLFEKRSGNICTEKERNEQNCSSTVNFL